MLAVTSSQALPVFCTGVLLVFCGAAATIYSFSTAQEKVLSYGVGLATGCFSLLTLAFALSV